MEKKLQIWGMLHHHHPHQYCEHHHHHHEQQNITILQRKSGKALYNVTESLPGDWQVCGIMFLEMRIVILVIRIVILEMRIMILAMRIMMIMLSEMRILILVMRIMIIILHDEVWDFGGQGFSFIALHNDNKHQTAESSTFPCTLNSERSLLKTFG